MLDGFIPLPNASVVGANYIANGIRKMDEDAFAIRTDHSLTSKDQFPCVTMTISASSILSTSFYRRLTARVSLHPVAPAIGGSRAHTHLFGSSGANEFRFGLNR